MRRRSDARAGAPPGVFRPRLTHWLVLLALTCWQLEMQASQVERAARDAAPGQAPVEFDNNFLHGGNGLDLSRFAHGNAVAAGTYRVDIFVNGIMLKRDEMRFAAVADKADAQPCLDKPLLQRAGVDMSRLTEAPATTTPGCLRIDQAVPGATASFDLNSLRLDLSIPQAMLERTPRGYVEPEQWDAGAPVAMLGYNFNTSQSQTPGGASNSYSYLGIAGGLNYGRWYLRHNGSLSLGQQGGQRRYQSINTYVQRDLIGWSSRLLIGETYTSGELMDSTPFRGIRLYTDDRMLPESQRGYAPVVRGVANTNARVTISQGSVKLYEATVAPGAFVINDLYPTGYGGDLLVRITEANGAVRSFSIPYAAAPLSLREGRHRYSLTSGVVRHLPNTSPLFAQGSWQYGMTNMLTGYGGLTLARGYASPMAGLVLNTDWGAWGMDITHANTQIAGEGSYSGQSLRANYAKTLPQTGTSIALAAYRYSTRGFFGLNDAMRARDQAEVGQPSIALYRPRNRASLSISQHLSERHGNLNLVASTARYWNRQGRDLDFSVGYSNAYRNLSYNISAGRQRDAMGISSTQLYVGLSIPLGGNRPSMMNTYLSRSSRGMAQAQANVSGLLNDEGNLSYGLSANHSSGLGDRQTTGGATGSYRGPFAEVSGSVSAGSDFQQLSASVRGAVVAHPGGVTLSQPLSETFGIIEAKNAEGAKVTNASGVRIDSRGYAVVPHLTPYVMNEVTIDPKGLSTDVELMETSQHVAPLAGAVPMVVFKTQYGRSAVIRARQPNGMPVPFGAVVSDMEGQDIALVGQAGKLLVRGLEDKGQLQVQWETEGGKAHCNLSYALPEARRGAGVQPPPSLELPCVDGGTTLLAKKAPPTRAEVQAQEPVRQQLQAAARQATREAARNERDLAGLRMSTQISVLVPAGRDEAPSQPRAQRDDTGTSRHSGLPPLPQPVSTRREPVAALLRMTPAMGQPSGTKTPATPALPSET